MKDDLHLIPDSFIIPAYLTLLQENSNLADRKTSLSVFSFQPVFTGWVQARFIFSIGVKVMILPLYSSVA